jgi:hypothetical protein
VRPTSTRRSAARSAPPPPDRVLRSGDQTDPMHLEHTALLVGDYDDAIEFFVEALGF